MDLQIWCGEAVTQEGGEQCGVARVVAEVSAYAVSLVRLASGEAGVCGGTAVSLPSRHRPSLGSPSRSLCLPHRPPLGSPSDTAVHVWSGLDVTGAGPVCDEPLPTTATTTCALPPPLQLLPRPTVPRRPHHRTRSSRVTPRHCVAAVPRAARPTVPLSCSAQVWPN